MNEVLASIPLSNIGSSVRVCCSCPGDNTGHFYSVAILLYAVVPTSYASSVFRILDVVSGTEGHFTTFTVYFQMEQCSKFRMCAPVSEYLLFVNMWYLKSVLEST